MPELNYFSATENLWQKCHKLPRRLTPLDWAYLGTWEDAGIPLEAVLLGITRTFARFKTSLGRESIRHLAYCQAEIYRAAEALAEDELQGHGELRRALRRQFLGEDSQSVTETVRAGGGYDRQPVGRRFRR